MKIPKSVNDLARSCLTALQNSGQGRFISLGGAIALAHYYDYRATKDVDAWWTEEATEEIKKSIIKVLNEALNYFGSVSVRRFGDVVSVDLSQNQKIIFNFQIANRSVLLRPYATSPWPEIKLDSLDDLIASKMTALIERGAPRDFLDIYTICAQGLAELSQCWNLWQEREKKRGVVTPEINFACEALLLHLSRIEKSRPLASIKDRQERAHAQAVREWFYHEFCSKKSLD